MHFSFSCGIIYIISVYKEKDCNIICNYSGCIIQLGLSYIALYSHGS